jgi:hypothetical protein
MQIPAKWQAVLSKVQIHFPSAVIAGGALRDLWHNQTPKDVDIFIPVDEPEDNLYVDQMADLDPMYELIAASIYGQEQVPATRQNGLREIFAIYRLNIDGIVYELIFIQADDAPVHTVFDINICQAAYDGQEVVLTDEFLRGVNEKVLRVCNVNRKDRQTKRLMRVAEKYPEYTVETIDDSGN